ncbi:MAG: hypothetical protein ACXAC5_01805 [Promethearchaeota archaeon]|jgi:hypothetical protein
MSPLKLPIKLTSNEEPVKRGMRYWLKFLCPKKIRVRIHRRWVHTKEEEKKSKGLLYWIVSGVISLGLLLIVKAIFPSSTPFDTFEFWKENQVLTGIKASWPIFLWGAAVTSIVAFSTRNKRSLNKKAEDILVGGVFVSAIAGVFEEMVFRWIIFLWGIVGVKVVNFLFFGFLGFGLAQFIHNWIVGPIVNFVTFGKMQWLIFDMGWAVGASALAANAKFRTEHAYLGVFGLLNSWIIGFFLFWVMFTYGLLAAITVHFLYDLFIFIIRYVDAAIERQFKMGLPG